MKFLRFLFFPFSVLYDLITSIRNFFFNVGIFKETTFKTPTIVVGNLSVGGTGKTPQIEYLVRLLKDVYKTAILSRGYKRKTKGFVLLNKNHSAEDVGDEPLQYFKKFKNIDVAVDADRVAGVQKLLSLKSLEVILLDDAYQHRKIKGSFYILLTKYKDLFVDDFLLPTGNLRESRSGAKRTNIILVTKCPENLSKEEQNEIKNKLKKFHKQVFFTSISYAENLSGNTQITINELIEYQVLLITGIANPKPFTEFLKKKEIKFQHLKFSDHHHFSSEEIKTIQQNFKDIKTPKKLILTTEKDFVRLENKLPKISYLAIETSFLNSEKEKFDNLIENHIQNK